ncbi:hypothetical protein TNCV_5071511 [Trichonephila clavipes]|nr:hypothetical protein TNCV_5071511 [Trichonephila clavipes]
MGTIDRGYGKSSSFDHRPIRVSSIRMTAVELPYVPILLNETFITTLWDTGAENHRNQRHPSQQNKEKKPQYGSVGRRSGT